MGIEISKELLIDYLKGNLSEADCLKVKEWYALSPENQEVLDNLYFTLFVSDRLAVMERIDLDKSLSELKERIKEKEQSRNTDHKFKGSWIRKTIIAAAVFAGVIFAGGSTIKHLLNSLNQTFMVYTEQGERTKVVLPDGTLVWLNACSKVKYASSLFSSERRVDMEGEAYFEVKKDKHAPFVVNSCGVSTHVLGTKFNIRANKEEKDVIATLLEGSILITVPRLENKQAKMVPNEQLRVNRRTGEMEMTRITDSEEGIWWINGRLHFEKETFSNMAAAFEKHYNVNIIFMDEKIKQERFTSDFETKENIYQILSILRLTNKFDYEIRNRQILIYSKK